MKVKHRGFDVTNMEVARGLGWETRDDFTLLWVYQDVLELRVVCKDRR